MTIALRNMRISTSLCGKKNKIKHPKHRSGDPLTQEQEKLPLTGGKLVQDQVSRRSLLVGDS